MPLFLLALILTALAARMVLGNFVKLNNVIPGVAGYVRHMVGVPSAGTTEVQTLTIPTSTAGTFRLEMDGVRSALINWNDNAATIQTKLRAMGNIGVTGATVTGTFIFTFGGGLAAKLLSTFVVVDNTVVNGVTPAVPTIVKTTPGVTASYRGSTKGTVLVNDSTGIAYINTGTDMAPVWTVVGAQT